jgi:hypothetical protein
MTELLYHRAHFCSLGGYAEMWQFRSCSTALHIPIAPFSGSDVTIDRVPARGALWRIADYERSRWRGGRYAFAYLGVFD